MVGRYPGRNPSGQPTEKEAEAHLKLLLETGIDTFVSLNLEVTTLPFHTSHRLFVSISISLVGTSSGRFKQCVAGGYCRWRSPLSVLP